MNYLRAKIGLLIPSFNSCSEPNLNRMAPRGVAFYSTRLRLRNGSREELLAMADGLEPAASLLADLRPDLIMFHCTAGSLIGGHGYDQRLVSRIKQSTGIPAGTTATAIATAVVAIGSRRIALVTPYPPSVNDAEIAFLAAGGFDVVSNLGLALDSDTYAAVTPEAWYRHVQGQLGHGEDCVFLSCANIRAVEVIQRIEDDFGLPVISSDQAALWWALRRLGITDAVPGYGRLLMKYPDLPVSRP